MHRRPNRRDALPWGAYLMRYVLITALALITAPGVFAQSRTDYLRRLDTNRNGRLEPDEISDRVRPYLERFAREAGIRLSGSISISQLESASRRYYERRNREQSDQRNASSSTRSFSSNSTGVERSMSIPGFGPDEDTPLVPGFGPDSEIRYPYIAADEQQADETLRRYDKNQDGGIDRAEADGGRWRGDLFAYDFNQDGIVSRLELAQRYARRRLGESGDNQSDSSRSSRGDSGNRSDERRSYGDRREEDSRRDESSSRRSDAPARSTYELANSIISRHDRNRNRKLDRVEWSRAGENIQQADADRDSEITVGELAAWLSRDIQKRYKDFSRELPSWFFELDANEDHQISMSEFTEEWDDEKFEEFAGFDSNGDGILTEKELLGSKSAVGGTYVNEKAVVIMPAGIVASDITVNDEYLIGDVDVQLSITHTNDEQLNVYLIGPDEQEIELFTGVGRGDDHFDSTILDDEARERITRSRPPFRGRFMPEGKEKDGPSLSHFYGKSIHGNWRLEIRTSRGDRPGMLHGWSLIVERPDQLDSESVKEEPPPAASKEERQSSNDDRSSYRRPPYGGR